MRILTLALPVAAVFVLAHPAHAEPPSKKTQAFIEKAAVSNQFEIESSRLALEKSQNPEVKKFAQMMVDDHTKAGAQMKAAVAESGLTAPEIPVSLDKEHNETVAELRGKSGKDFDEEYLDEQKDAHDDAVALFRDYAKDGDNTTLQQFAAETLPTLEAHLEHVKKLEEAHD